MFFYADLCYYLKKDGLTLAPWIYLIVSFSSNGEFKNRRKVEAICYRKFFMFSFVFDLSIFAQRLISR